jgi:predicted Mrr-cat superfamily restriction endonuclease
MAKREEDVVEEKEPVDDYSVAVMDAVTKRGLKVSNFDIVDVKYLWTGNYRVNCYAAGLIKNSYFIRFTKEEGILRSWPEL